MTHQAIKYLTGESFSTKKWLDILLDLSNCVRYNAPRFASGFAPSQPLWSAEVAQSVEQRTENPRVRSSILRLGTIYIRGLELLSRGFNLFYYAQCAQIVPKKFMVVGGEGCCGIFKVGF